MAKTTVPNAEHHSDLGFNPDTVPRATLRKRVSTARGRVQAGTATQKERALVRLWDDPSSGLKRPPGPKARGSVPNTPAGGTRDGRPPAPMHGATDMSTPLVVPVPSMTTEADGAIPHAPPPNLGSDSAPDGADTGPSKDGAPSASGTGSPSSGATRPTAKPDPEGGAAMAAAGYMMAVAALNDAVKARGGLFFLNDVAMDALHRTAVQVFAPADGVVNPKVVVIGTPIALGCELAAMEYIAKAKAKKEAQARGKGFAGPSPGGSAAEEPPIPQGTSPDATPAGVPESAINAGMETAVDPNAPIVPRAMGGQKSAAELLGLV